MDSLEHESLLKLALMVENDCDQLGWKQPPRLYALTGTVDDPALRLVCELPSASPAILRAVTDRVREASRGAFGLVLCAEGHGYPKDLHQRPAVLAVADALWGVLPPQWHPRRVRERDVTLVLGDGGAYTVRRERGGQPEALAGYDVTRTGSVAQALRQLVTA